MGWVKLDDGFYDHPRMLDRSFADLGLWAVGLAYANKHLTDGFIPASFVTRRKGKPDALVGCGAWEPVDGGWQIRDYLQHQRSAEEIRELAAKRAAAGSKGGSKPKASAQADAKQTGKQERKEENREEAAEAARRLAPGGRQGLINAAATLIAERRGARDKGGPGYFGSAVRGIAGDYHDAAHEHLTANPGLTSAALAELLEPPVELKPPFVNCPECKARYQTKDGTCLFGYDVCPMRRAI